MKVLLTLDGTTAAGGTPLVLHNERLADPLDEYTRAVSRIAKKKNKTDADHLEIGRLEFLGGLYVDNRGPCLPAFNILRCLQEAAKRTKRGRDVLRGVSPILQTASLAYKGPRNPEEMWRSGQYALRKSVGVKGNRTMRTRPIFVDWSAVLPMQVDPTIFDPDVLAAIWKDAGIYEGMCEMRPIYGRFSGTLTEWTIRTDDGIGEAAWKLATAIAAQRIEEQDGDRREAHGPVEELIRGALARAKAIGTVAEKVAAK